MLHLRTTLAVLLIASFTIQAKEKPKVCIMKTDELNNKVPDLGKTAESKLEDMLVNFGCVDLVSKLDVEDILKNNNISMENITEDELIKHKSIITGVDFFIFGEVSNGNISRTFSTKTNSDGTKKENYWSWRCTPSVKFQVLEIKNGKIIYSQKETALSTMEEAVQEEKALAGVVNMIKAIKDTSNKKEADVDPNLLNPQLAVNSTSGAVTLHKDKLYNIFRPSGVIISIEDADKKGKKKTITFDLGQNFGLKPGNKIEIIKKSPDITHPTTGEVIAGKETILLTLKIENVDAELSTAIAKTKDLSDVAVGTLVKMVKR